MRLLVHPWPRALPALAMLGCLLGAGATAATGQPRPQVGCELCHGELEFLRQQVPTLDQARRLLVSEAQVRGSAHDTLSCVNCHSGFGRFPHPADARVTRTCVSCHDESVEPWREGVHGQPGEQGEPASCEACHGVHDVVAPSAAAATARLNEACLTCHPSSALPPSDPHSEAISCASCHDHHRILSLEDPEGGLAPLAQAETCGACHAGPGRDAPTDAHGAALQRLEQPPGLAGLPLLADAPPTCTSCHGAHGMRAPSHERFDQEMVDQCGACHEQATETYYGTYHGKATALGSEIVATCDRCHGSHQIFPASDSRSKVAPENLTTTCSACHEHTREAFVLYDSHPDPMDRGRNAPLFFSFVFMNTLLFGVLGVFTLHTLLWWVRLMLDRRRPTAEEAGERHG